VSDVPSNLTLVKANINHATNPAEEMIADAGAASAGAAPPLLGAGLADPDGLQRGNVGEWIIGVLFHLQDVGQEIRSHTMNS
jgi:hypothetical protein